MTIRLSALCLSLLLAAPVAAQRNSAQGADPAVIVTKASRNYRALTSLLADFKMRVEDKVLGNEDSKGTIAALGPTKFRMLFTSPMMQFYLVDGKDEYIYWPSTAKDQVTRRPVSNTPNDGLNYIALFLDNPAERYALNYLRSETVGGRTIDVVEMVAKARDLPFRSAVVSFDRDDGLPRMFNIDFVTHHKILELNRLQTNLPLPDSLFKFTKPAGARIISP